MGKKSFAKFSQIGPAAIPFLLRVAQTEDIGSYADTYALGALGSLGARARSALPELEKLFKEGKVAKTEWAREDYYLAVSRLGGQRAFDILSEALMNEELEINRKIGIMIILQGGDYGVADERIMDLLDGLLKKDNEKLRIAAYLNLSSPKFFEKPGVDQRFLKGLEDPSKLVQYNVINFLGNRRGKGDFALQKLKEIMEDPATAENFGGLNLRKAAQDAYSKIQDAINSPAEPSAGAPSSRRHASR